MSSLAARMPAATVMHNDGTATANGTSLDVTGALRTILFCFVDGAAPTAGVLTFEVSRDGGQTWSAINASGEVEDADGANPFSTLAFGSLPSVVKFARQDGPALIRARISTAFDGGGVDVLGVAIGK